MLKTLTIFWCKRFIQIAVIVAVILFVVEYFKTQVMSASALEVLFWSWLAGVVGASTSTYWAYKKHCKMAFNHEEHDEHDG